MSTADAAPLMCAGMTVFTPFARYNIRPTDRVGVVGIGALGHLAVQFASKMGCDVVAFSTTDSKEKEARELGARTFVTTGGKSGEDAFKAEWKGRAIDHLLVCTSVVPDDWLPYIGIMAPYGTVYALTVHFGDMKYPFMPALHKDLAFRISTGASTTIYNQMFEFAVLHNIKPKIETFPLTLEGLAEAQHKMLKGQVRYKAVMEVKH
jgi:D-arabinose 1-dehydrogenase-like Zn-dependent alcohol dehydrogenase